MRNAKLAWALPWRENELFEKREKNVFDKSNAQYQVYLSIAMTRIRNRRHEAFSEVERQNALFEEREKHKQRSANKGGTHSFSLLKSELSHYQNIDINIPSLLF